MSVFSVLNDPADQISRALMLRNYMAARGDQDAYLVPLAAASLEASSDLILPAGWHDLLKNLGDLPLFEASERIISFFGLGEDRYNTAWLNTFQDRLLEFAGNKYAGLQSFLDWWEASGRYKSVVLPGGQEAVRILTIHKSKGLEFGIVILPFISWNLDYKPSQHPFLWVRPQEHPFSDLGIVPVKYGQDLMSTIFSKEYIDERYSVHLDNINLLYVAFTRAKDAIIGFSVSGKNAEKNVPGLLKEALSLKRPEPVGDCIDLSLFLTGDSVFEYGELPVNRAEQSERAVRESPGYRVSGLPGSLRLKLHGENYFSSESEEVRKRINYGKLMHEVFAGIRTKSDVHSVLRNMVIEGKLPSEDYEPLAGRIMSCLDDPQVAEWFSEDNEVLTETGIIIPGSGTKRPDRVIFRNGRTVVIDFKFGSENPRYITQVSEYRRLLLEMGYNNVEACLWYVDRNKIVSA